MMLIANRITKIALCMAIFWMNPTSQSTNGHTDNATNRQEVHLAVLYGVTENQFLSQMETLGLQEESVFAARGLFGTLTLDLEEIDMVLQEFRAWNGARPIYRMDVRYESSTDRLNNHLIRRMIVLNRKAVETYFDHLQGLEVGHRELIEMLRRRHHRSILMRSRNRLGIEGASVDVIEFLKDSYRRHYGFPIDDLSAAAVEKYESSLEALSSIFDERQRVSLSRSTSPNESQGDQDYGVPLLTLENKVREANRRCVDELSTSLSSEFTEVFQAEIREIITPLAWGKPEYHQFAEYAKKKPDLDAPVAESIRETLVNLDRQREDMSRMVEQAYDERHSPREEIRVMRLDEQSETSARRQKTDTELALEKAWKKLNQYDADGLKQIQNVMGQRARRVHEEYIEQLPVEGISDEPVLRDPIMDYDGSLPRAKWGDLEDILSGDVEEDPEKAKLLESRYESYRNAFGEAKRDRDAALSIIPALNEIMSEPNDKQRFEKADEIVLTRGAVYAQWTKEAARVESTFILEIQDILGEELGAEWMDGIRRQRRAELLPVLELLARVGHGRTVLPDLVSIVEEAELSAEGMNLITELIEFYKTELDQSIWDFAEKHQHAQNNVFALFPLANRTNDPVLRRKANRWLDKMNQLRRKPIDITNRYVQIIEDTLESDDRIEFQEAVRQTLYPWTTARPPVDLLVSLLGRVRSEEAGIRQIVDVIYPAYLANRRYIIDDIVRLLDRWLSEYERDNQIRWENRIWKRQHDRLNLQIDTLRMMRNQLDAARIEALTNGVQALLESVP